jgi:hypothetical protein
VDLALTRACVHGATALQAMSWRARQLRPGILDLMLVKVGRAASRHR